MDEHEIFNYIQKCKHLKYRFRGVFAADNFPTNMAKNSFVIVNISSSQSPGLHWILLAKNSSNNLYFADPLGFSIENFPIVLQQVKNCSFNKLIDIMETRNGYTKNLQSVNSQLCGLFCIYIAHYFYNAINFIIPNVNNELELINFVKHMMS